MRQTRAFIARHIAGVLFTAAVLFGAATFLAAQSSSVVTVDKITGKPTGGWTRNAATSTLSPATAGDTVAANDGTALAPGFAFASDPDTGFFRLDNNYFGVTTGGSVRLIVSSLGLIANGVPVTVSTVANSSKWSFGYATELITLSTTGTTTDSSANLLPANSIIEAVTARVTTDVATATGWSIGDGSTAARFLASQTGAQLTAGATAVGLAHWAGTIAAVQASAEKLRITTTGTPSAGVIRVTVYYRTFVAPTS